MRSNAGSVVLAAMALLLVVGVAGFIAVRGFSGVAGAPLTHPVADSSLDERGTTARKSKPVVVGGGKAKRSRRSERPVARPTAPTPRLRRSSAPKASAKPRPATPAKAPAPAPTSTPAPATSEPAPAPATPVEDVVEQTTGTVEKVGEALLDLRDVLP